MSRWVAGVDGWRGRWVAAYLENGALETVRVHESLPALEADDLWSELAAVGVDAPIGLPHGAERRAVIQAAIEAGETSDQGVATDQGQQVKGQQEQPTA